MVDITFRSFPLPGLGDATAPQPATHPWCGTGAAGGTRVKSFAETFTQDQVAPGNPAKADADTVPIQVDFDCDTSLEAVLDALPPDLAHSFSEHIGGEGADRATLLTGLIEVLPQLQLALPGRAGGSSSFAVPDGSAFVETNPGKPSPALPLLKSETPASAANSMPQAGVSPRPVAAEATAIAPIRTFNSAQPGPAADADAGPGPGITPRPAPADIAATGPRSGRRFDHDGRAIPAAHSSTPAREDRHPFGASDRRVMATVTAPAPAARFPEPQMSAAGAVPATTPENRDSIAQRSDVAAPPIPAAQPGSDLPSTLGEAPQRDGRSPIRAEPVAGIAPPDLDVTPANDRPRLEGAARPVEIGRRDTLPAFDTGSTAAAAIPTPTAPRAPGNAAPIVAAFSSGTLQTAQAGAESATFTPAVASPLSIEDAPQPSPMPAALPVNARPTAPFGTASQSPQATVPLIPSPASDQTAPRQGSRSATPAQPASQTQTAAAAFTLTANPATFAVGEVGRVRPIATPPEVRRRNDARGDAPATARSTAVPSANAAPPAAPLAPAPVPVAARPDSVRPLDLAFMPELSAAAFLQPGAPGPAITGNAVPVAPADLSRHVAHQLATAAPRPGDQEVELRLNPEELGRLRLTLRQNDGAITVAILAERGETLDLMRRHIAQLETEFREIGYRDIQFSFGTSGHGTAGGQAEPGSDGPTPLPAQSPQPAPAIATADTCPPAILRADGLDLRL